LSRSRDLLAQRLVAGTAAQRGAQVMSRSREQAGVEHPLGREPGARAAAAERLADRGDDADLTRAVPVAVPGCDLAGIAGRQRSRGHCPPISAMISAAGTTSSSRHPLVVPTSMYSMKRSTCPLPRK
jgi:hypothetical protein